MLVYVTEMTDAVKKLLSTRKVKLCIGDYSMGKLYLNGLGLQWGENGDGAIYAYGMTNDFINNRMTGHSYGFWTPVRDLQTK